jgi:hypothetical protein
MRQCAVCKILCELVPGSVKLRMRIMVATILDKRALAGVDPSNRT